MSFPGKSDSTADATRLATGSGLVVLGMGVGRGIKLLTRLLIGRLTGAAGLGLYDLAWTVVLILTHLARGGLQVATVRFGAPLWSRKQPAALSRLVQRALLVPAVLGGAVAVALFFAAPWLAVVFAKPELAGALRILAPLVPVTSCLAVLAGATQATQRMGYTVLTRDIADPVSQFVLFLVLWGLGFGLASALWGALFGGILALLLALGLVRHLILTHETALAPPEGQKGEETLRQLVLFSLPVAVSGLLTAYLLWFDRLLVGFFRSASAVGIYSAAAQFGILCSLLLHGFSTTFTPMFSDLLDRGETERMRELYRISTKWGLYLLLPLMIVLAIQPEVALGGLFGAEFVSGARVLQILLIGQFVNVLSGQVGMVLVLSGRRRSWMILTAIALVMNVILDLLWIPRFGLEGAAAASSLALVLLFGGGLWAARGWLDIFPLDARLWKLVPSIVGGGAAVMALGRLGLGPTFTGLLVCLAGSYSTALAVRLLLPADAEDQELWEAGIRWLRASFRKGQP